ncbi:hypothetical protein ASG92_18290 [Arthrobacter sp. Soil736]|nr:hypothetical protein ASG92_18290 [Arthrobacter sp. Soil736]
MFFSDETATYTDAPLFPGQENWMRSGPGYDTDHVGGFTAASSARALCRRPMAGPSPRSLARVFSPHPCGGDPISVGEFVADLASQSVEGPADAADQVIDEDDVEGEFASGRWFGGMPIHRRWHLRR